MPKNREKGHGVKGSGPPLREIAISAGMGSAVVLALLTVFALVMSAQDIPGGLTAPMVTITLVVGTLAAGYRCGRQLRQNGIVNGGRGATGQHSSGVVRGRVYPMPDPGESTAGYTGTGPVGIVA